MFNEEYTSPGKNPYTANTSPLPPDMIYAGVQPRRAIPPKDTAPAESPPTPRKRRAGLVAAMLAMALIGGAAGGGTAAWWFSSRQADEDLVPAASMQELVEPVATPPETAALISPAGDITGVVQKAADSVVEISLDTRVRTFFGEQDMPSAGSGVIISEDGYIVTNNHVVENGSSIIIRTSDGTEYEAELIGTDKKTDLAVIKIETTNLTSAVFSDSNNVQVGQIAVAIGNPLGTLGGTVTSGIISAKVREIDIDNQSMTLMQTSAAVNPGNSGGGLFDANGELIGIVNAKSSGLGVEGLGFAIPSNIVREVADDLIENGYVTGRPELGITIVQVDDSRAAAYYGVGGIGVYIMETTRPNGLEPGDRIVSIDGKPVEASGDVSEAVGASKVGDTMRVVVEREGKETEVTVVVAEQIPDSVKERIPQPTGEI